MLLGLLALVSAFASSDTRHELRDGFYVPTSSNNASVCPQQLKTVRVDGKLSALRVTYVGDCAEWGPFEYYCLEESGELSCESSHQIRFVIRDREHFSWRNEPYEIWAEFERKSD